MTVDLTGHLKTCRRSHPHEDMDEFCERYAQYERELASLRAECDKWKGQIKEWQAANIQIGQRAERAEAERDAKDKQLAACYDRMNKAEAERDAAVKDAEAKLKAQAAEAYADVDEWAAYASEYFRAKWDLPGTLQKWRDRFEPDAARKGEQ